MAHFLNQCNLIVHHWPFVCDYWANKFVYCTIIKHLLYILFIALEFIIFFYSLNLFIVLFQSYLIMPGGKSQTKTKMKNKNNKSFKPKTKGTKRARSPVNVKFHHFIPYLLLFSIFCFFFFFICILLHCVLIIGFWTLTITIILFGTHFLIFCFLNRMRIRRKTPKLKIKVW